ncbi:MAG: outer membrane beta-barrel protein [Bacteroidales bacterium]|nr:outer membrane beta-barrel protein [Bacteroidales bacterium]
MFRNETFIVAFTLFLASGVCSGQKTWWGEYSFFGGGGTNDIFRFSELDGAGSVTGTGMWTAGFDMRRMFGDHFSIETRLSYSHQKYYTSPAPGIEGEDLPGSLGMLTMPVTARLDFLRWFFVDAGPFLALQTGSSHIDNMTGLGATLGAGFQYNFRSDIFLRVRAYGAQYGLLHFTREEYPQTMSNAGLTLGVGYRFIRLGKCNCPDDNRPGRRSY